MTEFNTIHAENMALSATTRDRYQQNLDLIHRVLDIYSLKFVAETLSNNWTRDRLKRWLNGKSPAYLLSDAEQIKLQKMLPQPPLSDRSGQFSFIDLFAGIGGIRKGFDAIGGRCVFTSEWNPHAIRTYKANWYNDPEKHTFNTDIRDITLSNQPDKNEQQAYQHIDRHIPDHEVLLAGFPCQPFSLAGVSKKNSLGRKHGFECETQGTLFFDVARIIAAKQPAIFVLENVKNLKSHDNGNTFRVIMNTLDELGYHVADAEASGADDPKVIDGKHFLPQHRERIVLVGFRRDLQLGTDFTLRNIVSEYPVSRPALADLLDKNTDQRYILSPRLWEYLYYYAKKHRQKGNGFGYGLVDPNNPTTVCRTLSARYYKDGSEILLDRGWDSEKGETDFYDITNQAHRPRRLSPRECARLMGFDAPGEANFRIPVSDTQAYRQFGNSVVVPVFAAVARLLKPYIMQSKIMQNKRRRS